MLIRESDNHLRAMLADGGVNLQSVTASDPSAILELFERFTRIPVDDAAPAEEDGDALLAQFGTFNFRGNPEFSTELTRQLIEAGEDDGAIWQLSCTLYWEATSETDALASGELWSFGLAIDTFFARTSQLPGWSWALGNTQAPRDAVVGLEQV